MHACWPLPLKVTEVAEYVANKSQHHFHRRAFEIAFGAHTRRSIVVERDFSVRYLELAGMDVDLIRTLICLSINCHQTVVCPFSPKLYVEDVEAIVVRLDAANLLSVLVFSLAEVDSKVTTLTYPWDKWSAILLVSCLNNMVHVTEASAAAREQDGKIDQRACLRLLATAAQPSITI